MINVLVMRMRSSLSIWAVMMTMLIGSSRASQCGDDVYIECEEKAQRGLCQVYSRT